MTKTANDFSTHSKTVRGNVAPRRVPYEEASAMEATQTENAREAEEEAANTEAAPETTDRDTNSSLFPVILQPSNNNNDNSAPSPQIRWLSNRSFTADVSAISGAAYSQHSHHYPPHFSESEEEEDAKKITRPQSYELLESSSSSDRNSSGKRDRGKEEKKKKKEKRRKRSLLDASFSKTSHWANDFGATSRKPNVQSWAASSADDTKSTAKGYYFDSRGDRDNLAFGCLYRMDVARYKLQNSMMSDKLNSGAFQLKKRSSIFDGEIDIDALDNKLKAGGRYWSAKYFALERHRNLKRFRITVPKNLSLSSPEDFIPFSVDQISQGADDGSLPGASTVEESWEDEVLRKTREFNKMSREHPCDEKVWIAFAEFQDKVASMQSQKGARLQTLEKKISILEKATELNPDNEELLLRLLNAYQSRDSSDVFIGRWEKILIQHSGNCKLWKEFLRVVQGEFSRFKVSDMRKLYANAIQALSAACSRLHRQVHQTANAPSSNPAIVEQELGLVDIFLSLCRFEWQGGYQELATALFQAEIEYSLFSPPLLLTELSKRRLFEHFWNSNGARFGEDGALGWSTWLEKEEEERRKITCEESLNETEEGGWTGWSLPLSKRRDVEASPKDIEHEDDTYEEFDDEVEARDTEQKDDTEALLKMLGINADTNPSGEVTDPKTWHRWSEEELSRDFDQWMPIHPKSDCKADGISHGTPDREGDDQLLRVMLFEDVNEYLFSLSSEEARLSLVFQFIDFYGGRISTWSCTNSSSWAEKTLSLEAVPCSIIDNLRRVHDVLTKTESISSSLSFESLLDSSHRIVKRTDIMKFLRNAILCCLTVFPHNYILEEAALLAEELLTAELGSVMPCRDLAKRLLKSNRQDVLLCGVYARREAAYGNIDHARKVFDMALTSTEGLPSELQSKACLLYFWYAESEIGWSSSSGSEELSRAIYILCCFGSGAKYTPFKCKPTSLQQLRARQGFKERIRMLRSTCARGVIDDHSIALICSAALFEELTVGCFAGVEVLTQAFSIVLPERRSQSYQFEFLFNFYVKMLWRQRAELKLSKVWESILQGLQIYPFNQELYSSLVEVSHFHSTPNKLRWIFDKCCQKSPSVVVWLFALSFEMSRGGSQHRIRGLFEKAFTNEKLRNSVLLWRCYIAYEINVAYNPAAARRIFFRAIHACPWSKKLWLDGFLKLHNVLTANELSDLQEVMRDKELNLRTDIYEILLQDEIQL